nr:uncharacterized protein LOC118679833 [Bactrocera oleae]
MADGRSRLSGHQNKKRRLEKGAERQKQAGALESFLKKVELNKPSSPISETGAIVEIPLKPREEHTSDSNIICELMLLLLRQALLQVKVLLQVKGLLQVKLLL